MIALEHGELRCGRIDLDPGPREGEKPRRWYRNFWGTTRREEVALRGGERRVSRLVRAGAERGAA